MNKNSNYTDWDDYHKTGSIGTDVALLMMLADLTEVARGLENINRAYYKIAIDSLFREWQVLSTYADNRGLEYSKWI